MYELWFRKIYSEPIQDRSIRAAVRPGDRRLPNPKGTEVGTEALVCIIKVPGSEERNISPEFCSYTCKVRITALNVKPIGELVYDDLRFCSVDSQTRRSVKDQLFSIYSKHYTDDDIVTVVNWEYIEE